MNNLSVVRFLAIFSTASAMSLSAAEPRSGPPLTNSISQAGLTLEPPVEKIWQDGVGEGFRSETHSFSVIAGAGAGIAAFGSLQAYDIALMSLSYGGVLGGVKGEGHWYRGNWELRGELFGGAEFAPSGEWIIGLTPHLRYTFATGSRFLPFIDGGVGVTATGIGPPDLSNTFEFNLQGGGGMHWLLRDDVALTVEARYIHMSCAGISKPNNGINTVMGMVGVTWLF